MQQLSQLSQQLQVEIQGLNRSLQGLQDASSRFGQSSECLEQIQEHVKDNASGEKQKMLVPLSQSVYVDGGFFWLE